MIGVSKNSRYVVAVQTLKRKVDKEIQDLILRDFAPIKLIKKDTEEHESLFAIFAKITQLSKNDELISTKNFDEEKHLFKFKAL